MNILFIGPYRQKDGWGEAAKDYCRALDLTKHNLKISPIYMGITPDANIGEQLEEMENRHFDDYDVIIQNVLPNLFEYHGDYRNIGLFYLETEDIQDTLWPRSISLMPEVWMTSEKEILTAQKSLRDKTTTKFRQITIPIDISKFDKEYKLSLPIPELKDNFVFYFVGEHIQRKNLEALLVAYHREFSNTEPVKLLIKTNRGGMKSDILMQNIQKQIAVLKQTLRIYKNQSYYQSEIIITDHIPYSDLMAIHQKCDCYVMPSSGEAYCRPLVDALGFGSIPIYTEATGMNAIVGGSAQGFPAKSHKTPVITTEPPMEEIYTARETWNEIDIPHLQGLMRTAFNMSEEHKDIWKKRGLERVKDFSYEKISKKMELALDDNSS